MHVVLVQEIQNEVKGLLLLSLW